MKRPYDALSYYEVLNVSPDDQSEVIKQQYYNRAKFWHPDHNEDPKALEMFQKVSVAYDTLKDANLRLQYDLLSLVYGEADFPQIGSLKIYKNQSDEDDPSLRVLKQRHVSGNFKKVSVSDSYDICNFREAGEMVLNTSISNWLKGWWGKGGWKATTGALMYNYQATAADDRENLKLLIHNALAYRQEKNEKMAWIYVCHALRMVEKPSREYDLLDKFFKTLSYFPPAKYKIPYWSSTELKVRQCLFPSVLIGFILSSFLFLAVRGGWFDFNKSAHQSYYEEREFSGGVLVPYDMIDAHIIQADSSVHDVQSLYHLKNDSIIYHGPDTRYDPLTKGVRGQTVRVVGYTADKNWFKIVLDNGEEGFIHRSELIKGIGRPVPENSKVFNVK